MTQEVRTHTELVEDFAEIMDLEVEELSLATLLDAFATLGYKLVDGGYEGYEKQKELIKELAEELVDFDVELSKESSFRKYKDGMTNAVDSSLFLSGMSLGKIENINTASEQFMDLMYDLAKDGR